MGTLIDFLLARIAEDEDDACSCCDEGDSVSGRMRLEAQAKRRIVEQIEDDCPHPPHVGGWCVAYCDRILKAVATVYAHHPDYREEWRP